MRIGVRAAVRIGALLGLAAVGGRGAAAEDCPRGYRVQAVRQDVVLGRTWAMVADCAHPERPAVMVAVAGPAASGPAARPSTRPAGAKVEAMKAVVSEVVVRAGDEVRAWSIERHVRVDVLAVAEESGVLGEMIHARVKRNAAELTGEGQRFAARVRGRASVEMVR